MPSAHLDTFAADHLPPLEQQPTFLFDLPELQFPAQLNCASELLDRHVVSGNGDRLCIQAPSGHRWTYADLQAQANRLAHVLTEDMGVVPGNRVLLRGANTPMLVACWFAVMKAGAIAVATMPLLRAKELIPVIQKAQVSHALCDARLTAELSLAMAQCTTLQQVMKFDANGHRSALVEHAEQTWSQVEAAMATKPATFTNAPTAATDTCIIAFTSGTTGQPKGTMHFHRDVMAACACWPREILRAAADDIFIGSPPLAFTFGLGGLVLFPMSVGASTVLLEQAMPPNLLPAIAQFGATVLFTAPTSYRALCVQWPEQTRALRGSTLRQCVSAGEALPATTRTLWREATGIELIDGIGATELLHIFISADAAHAKPGATGKAIRGYQACVMDDAGQPLPPGEIGKLAVRGPTGCRYLDDARQTQYVKDGWNYTGDAYLVDDEGYFFYQSRTDDMIVSAGYNIAAPEVEEALLLHPQVAECAVIGVPDVERGHIVKAFVVCKESGSASRPTAQALQEFVKQTIAPYKYPRELVFVDALPRTETGKLQRFRLRVTNP